MSNKDNDFETETPAEEGAEPEARSEIEDLVDVPVLAPDVSADEQTNDQTSDQTSDQTDDLTDDQADDIEAAAEEPVAEAKPQKKGGGAIGWLALLLSLVALAAVGYVVSQDWLAAEDTSAEDRVAGLVDRITDVEQNLPAIDRRIADLGVPDPGMTAEIAALRDELGEQADAMRSLPARISSVESSVAALSGVSQASRATWLLAEAEYYLQIANAQLQLANNPELAAQALGMADERILQISDPGLTDVRRAISDDRAALSVMDKPDIAGTTLTLASLARVVESLPLAGAGDAATESQPRPAETSGIERAWSSVKNAMSGLVKVTPPDQAMLTMISPDAEFFLRNNVALQLQSARLALLRGEQAVFEQALEDTSALINQYFDGDSAAVVGALETLTEVRNTVLSTAVPDISGSLRLLRQYRTLNESAQ